MRAYALYLIVTVLAIYAWRNWFVSCCGLVLLMAVMQHEDMPKSIAGVQGLNMFNVLLVAVTAAWLAQRRREGLVWDMPPHVMVLGLLYIGVIVAGFLRLMLDRESISQYPVRSMVSEELINTVKWIIPGVLIYDGCRSRRRLTGALVVICMLCALLAFQVVRRMPAASALGGGVRIHKLRLKTCIGIGYSAPDLSALLAGGSLALVAMTPLCRRRRARLAVLAAAAGVFYGQMLTGGRAGYAAWGVAALVMCLIRWRKALLLAPVVPLLLLLTLPGTVQRATQGFGEVDVAGEVTTDRYALTSGRNLIWPHVIEKIAEAPLLGYGRLAMIRTGLRDQLTRQYGSAETFPHPHNLYLEWVFDNGIIGAIPVAILFTVIVAYAGSLFSDRSNPYCAAAGGVALALVAAQLVAGMGSQHVYPRESTVGMWAAIFVMLRAWVERRRIGALGSRAVAVGSEASGGGPRL